MSPIINGQPHQLAARGLYNGLFLMGDYESGSYWDHITGECLHGPLKGQQLEPLGTLLQMSVAQALAMYPDAQLAVSSPGLKGQVFERVLGFAQRFRRDPKLPPHFAGTMAAEDTRRNRMDIGLGLWTGQTRRYYPLQTLRDQQRAVIDPVDGRNVLCMIDPLSDTPNAFYTSAQTCAWQGDDLHLDSGEVVRAGALHDATGQRQSVERPMQMFTRWYGFALTYPQCEIYGEEATSD